MNRGNLTLFLARAGKCAARAGDRPARAHGPDSRGQPAPPHEPGGGCESSLRRRRETLRTCGRYTILAAPKPAISPVLWSCSPARSSASSGWATRGGSCLGAAVLAVVVIGPRSSATSPPTGASSSPGRGKTHQPGRSEPAGGQLLLVAEQAHPPPRRAEHRRRRSRALLWRGGNGPGRWRPGTRTGCCAGWSLTRLVLLPDPGS